MYDQILKMMEDKKETVSFYARMEAFHKFLEKHDIYPHLYEPVPNEPVSFVWAISTQAPEMFAQQMGAIAQFPGIIQEHDQFIFVADIERRADILSVLGDIKNHINTKIVFIRRGCPGDRPTLNWDIGMEFVEHDRVMGLRDLVMFFQPWDLLRVGLTANIDTTLTSITTVLGPVWSRFCDQWVYLIHPQYAPTPYLFSFVVSKKNFDKVNGFDRVFSRGFDHSGELDFLLRWGMAGFGFDITDKTKMLHPGIPAVNMDVEEMRFQSSINRRYFMDRWGEEFIGKLKPPLSLDLPLIEVNDAHSLGPLMEVSIEEPEWPRDIKDIYTFAKLPSDKFIVEVI
jgi:hypothetical protein